jgi:hypothetical protein
MSDMNNGNREPEWVTPERGLAVGYQRDANGIRKRLIGVLIYDPTAERIRGLSLRNYVMPEPQPGTVKEAKALEAQGPATTTPTTVWRTPPSREEVEAAWQQVDPVTATVSVSGTAQITLTGTAEASAIGNALTVTPSVSATAQVVWPSKIGEAMATREGLTRIPGEPPADFYGRVAAAYTWLDGRGLTPTSDIALIADVPHSTAAKWVREARVRGLLAPTTRGKGKGTGEPVTAPSSTAAARKRGSAPTSKRSTTQTRTTRKGAK